MKKIICGFICTLLVLTLLGCSSKKVGSVEYVQNKYSTDSTFVFDDLEITISSNISFAETNDLLYKDDSEKVLKIPITIKNLKGSNHGLNIFYVSGYSPSGNYAEDYSTKFDDSYFYANQLSSGESTTTYLYYLYEGNGTYTIVLNDIFEEVSVDININK